MCRAAGDSSCAHFLGGTAFTKASIAVTPHAPFLTDEPDPLSSDAFGHGDYADALHSIVTDSSPPLAVGLFGPWGVGKSSIIGALQGRLDGSGTAFVYFDAWRYEEDSLRRQFLLDVASDLKKDGHLGKFDPKRNLRDVEYETQEIEESLGWHWPRIARLLIIAGIFGLVALALILLGVVNSLSSGSLGKKVLVALVTAVVAGLAAAVAQSISIDAVSLSRRRLEDPDRFAAKFAEVLQALKPKRLVIAIDNLDRSSPAKAIEVLATIKTYLEPIVSPDAAPRSSGRPTADKKIVFVIAVDDEALRRHLVAQERARSDRFDEVAAGRYVEEYLAKFFGARLPIRRLLDDDMRDYVARYMKPLAAARELGPDAERDLITVVNAGLRGNPRGVKQFHNDLEVRLRLLEEREKAKASGAPGISPPISGEVAMVAKLALIEREWPAAFARLQADPLVLERWMIEARRDDTVDWTTAHLEVGGQGVKPDEAEQPNAALLSDRRRLATFLRVSARVESTHLRAFLSLKQARIEVELPSYFEFHDSLTAGEREHVSEVLAAVSEAERGRLAGRITTILGEELERGHLDAARSIVDVVCSSDAFLSDDEVRRAVIERAADEPDLKREMSKLDPVAVLRTGELLEPAGRRRLFEPFLDVFHSTDMADDERIVMAHALAPYVDQFSSTQLTTLRTAIAGGLRDQPDLFLPFVEVDDSLLAPAALSSALDSLAAERGEGERPDLVRPLHERSPSAIEVVKVGMRQGPGEALERRLLVTINSVFNVVAPSQGDLEADLPALRDLLTSVAQPLPEESSVLARSIFELWGAVVEIRQREVIEFAGDVFAQCEQPVVDELAPAITARLFEAPAHALRVAAELDPVPHTFRAPFIERIDALKNAVEFWSDALAQLERIDPDGFAPRLIGAFDQLLRAGEVDPVHALLDSYGDVLRASGEMFTQVVAAALGDRLDQGNPGPPELLSCLATMLSPEELDFLGRRFGDALAAGPAEAAQAVLLELPAGGKGLRLLAAHHALPRINSDDESPPPAVLALVARTIGELGPDDQEYFAEQMAFRIRNYPGRAPELAQALMDVDGLPATPSGTIVEALLDAEKAAAELEARSSMLSAAWHLRVRRRGTRIWRRLEDRARELEAVEGDVDRELARRLCDWLEAG